MAVNLRKYTAINNNHNKGTESYRTKKGLDQPKFADAILFYYLKLVMSQPLLSFFIFFTDYELQFVLFLKTLIVADNHHQSIQCSQQIFPMLRG